MYIDKTKKRFNPNANIALNKETGEWRVITDTDPAKEGETTYSGNVLDFTDAVAIIGIAYLPDPVRPDDFNEDDSIWHDDDFEPYFAIVPRDPEQVARTLATRQRDEAQRYLDSTDYLFITDRHMELITLEPEREEELAGKRKEAREVIRAYKAKYPERV